MRSKDLQVGILDLAYGEVNGRTASLQSRKLRCQVQEEVADLNVVLSAFVGASSFMKQLIPWRFYGFPSGEMRHCSIKANLRWCQDNYVKK